MSTRERPRRDGRGMGKRGKGSERGRERDGKGRERDERGMGKRGKGRDRDVTGKER